MYEFTTDWVTHHVAKWQKHLARFIDVPTKALEIGSFEGRSTHWFLENILTHDLSKIHCVDIWTHTDSMRRFFKNASLSPNYNKIFMQRANSLTLVYPDNTFDFAYVDADHKSFSVINDMGRAWRALKKDGILIADDYKWSPDMTKALDFFHYSVYNQSTLLENGMQLILKKN